MQEKRSDIQIPKEVYISSQATLYHLNQQSSQQHISQIRTPSLYSLSKMLDTPTVNIDLDWKNAKPTHGEPPTINALDSTLAPPHRNTLKWRIFSAPEGSPTELLPNSTSPSLI